MIRRRLLCCAAVLFTTCCLVGHAAADSPPIVAVFDLDSGTLPIGSSVQQALTDFLSARLTGTGVFRTIPRSQIRQRLTKLKLESYKDCYDQACQIELGRELTAQLSLSSKLIKVDRQCLLTLELYDLASETAQAAATARGGCSEADLFQTIISAVDTLVGHLPSGIRAPTAPTALASQPAVAEQDKVSVTITSEPSGTDVLVDGLHRGVTPVRVAVARGVPFKVVLTREDYRTVQQTFTANDARTINLPLQLTYEGRMELAATSEWVVMGFGPGFLGRTNSGAFSALVRLGNIKTRWFFLTLFEFNMLGVTSDSQQQATSSGDSVDLIVGSRAGYPLYLGARGQHQLLFGLGAGYLSAESGDGAFALSPGVDYVYNAFDGMFPLGLSLRSHFPVAGEFSSSHYPFSVSASLTFGFSFYRMIKNAIPKNSAKVHDAEPLDDGQAGRRIGR